MGLSRSTWGRTHRRRAGGGAPLVPTKTRHRPRSSARSTRRGEKVHPTQRRNARNADAGASRRVEGRWRWLPNHPRPPSASLGPPSRRDRWPGATSRRGLGWRAHPNPPPWHAKRPQTGVAPVTASVSGAARPPRRPWCNRNPANGMRRRWSARPERVSAHTDPDVDVRSPPGPGDRVSGTETGFRATATGARAFPPRPFVRADRAVHHREESNDGTHETKSALVQRRRMGPEPGEGVHRSQDRPLPDGVARERAQAHPVAEAPRLDSGQEAGRRGRRGLRGSRAQRQRRTRAAHAGKAL